MKYRVCQHTGLHLSEVALGTWAFASQVYGPVPESVARDAIAAALEVGITLFDTAPLYGTAERDGTAEELLGRALGARRDDVLIATKFGRRSSDAGGACFSAAGARASVEASLRRLGTDRIDVLFFHSPFGAAEIEDDVWAELDSLRAEGKVRVIGHSISLFQQTKDMAAEWARERKIDAIQVVLSLMNREARWLIKELGSRQQIAVLAREALANGFLTGAVTPETTFAPGHLNARYSREEIAERAEQARAFQEVLVRGDVHTLPQAAMRWVLDQPGVTSVLCGAKSPDEIRDCAAASDAAPYSHEELERAEQLHRRDYPGA